MAAKSKKIVTPPPSMSAFRLDGQDDDVVVFVWESEQASNPLAPGEREVLRLLLAGLSNIEIATARGTSVRTIANQVASLLKKLGARSRFELIGRLGPGTNGLATKKHLESKPKDPSDESE